jgi:putative SOS response-associated peptidase YedK
VRLSKAGGTTRKFVTLALAGLRENWKDDPSTGEWVRTFVIITTGSNELVAEIHDRIKVVLQPEDDDRQLGIEPVPPESGTNPELGPNSL